MMRLIACARALFLASVWVVVLGVGGAALMVAGVHELLGYGASLVAAGAFMIAAAAIARAGAADD